MAATTAEARAPHPDDPRSPAGFRKDDDPVFFTAAEFLPATTGWLYRNTSDQCVSLSLDPEQERPWEPAYVSHGYSPDKVFVLSRGLPGSLLAKGEAAVMFVDNLDHAGPMDRRILVQGSDGTLLERWTVRFEPAPLDAREEGAFLRRWHPALADPDLYFGDRSVEDPLYRLRAQVRRRTRVSSPRVSEAPLPGSVPDGGTAGLRETKAESKVSTWHSPS